MCFVEIYLQRSPVKGIKQKKVRFSFGIVTFKVNKVINNAETMASDVDRDGVEWRTLGLSLSLCLSLSLSLSLFLPSLDIVL